MPWLMRHRQLHFLIEKCRQGGIFHCQKNLISNSYQCSYERECPICGRWFFSFRRALGLCAPPLWACQHHVGDRASYWASLHHIFGPVKKCSTDPRWKKEPAQCIPPKKVKTFPTMIQHWQSVTLRLSWCDRCEMAHPPTRINANLPSLSPSTCKKTLFDF